MMHLFMSLHKTEDKVEFVYSVQPKPFGGLQEGSMAGLGQGLNLPLELSAATL
jgi:hypothetical protein